MLFWLALSLAGCHPTVSNPLGVESDHHPGPPLRGGMLRIATSSDIRSLDSAVAFDETAAVLEQLVYAKLLDFSTAGDTFVPELAERWEASFDGLRYDFFLREDARFHDGNPVLARDVKRSLERTIHPDTPCPVKSFYERLVGYSDYVKRKAPHLEGIEVTGTYSLRFRLTEPDATLLSVLALPIAAPVCPSAGTTYDPAFSTHACGAGPFRLRQWDQGREVHFERFDGYYRPELPYLDGVTVSLVVPPFTQRLKFERGELDHFRDVSDLDAWLFRRSPAWAGRGGWEQPRSVFGIFLNTESVPFRNRELRRAVASAINRDELAALKPGSIQPASRIIPPGIPGHDPTPGQRFDYAAALEHMRSAGFPYSPATHQGGYPHELTLLAPSDGFGAQAGELFQQQLARIGIRIRIRALRWSAFLAESARRGQATLGIEGWGADYPDASDFFEPLLSSQSIADEDTSNRAFFSNSEFDRLLLEARRETDHQKRRELYRRAEQIFLDEAPWAVTHYVKKWEVWQPYLHEYSVHALLPQHVAFTWLDLPAKSRALALRHALPFSLTRVAGYGKLPGGS